MNEDFLALFVLFLIDIYLFIIIYLLRYVDMNDIIGFRIKKSYASRKNWEYLNKEFSKLYFNLF
jgi:hypothetical protein